MKIEKEILIKEDKLISFREYSEINKSKGYERLIDSFPEFDLLETVPDIVSGIKSVFRAVLNNDLPETTKSIRISQKNPWYTNECRKARLLKRSAEQAFLKSGSFQDWLAFNDMKKYSSKKLSEAKEKYYTNRFSIVLNNPKKKYNIISELLGNKADKIEPDLAKSDPQAFVERTEEFFHLKTQRIRAHLEKTNVSKRADTFSISYEPMTQFPEMTMPQLEEVVRKCKQTHCDLDILEFRKLDMEYINPYLLKMVNSIFNTGVFPQCEKTALIRPHIKDNTVDINDQTNLRPVSNVSYMDKVLESCIYYFLHEFVDIHDILPKYQSAYRPGYSTSTALTKIYSDLVTAKDEGRCTLMISLDLSAAFDTIDHDLLITDLFHIGIRGKALDVISSYLRCRTVKVQHNGCTSTGRPLLSGVPQGSVLGPLLFIIYTRSLAFLLDEVEIKYSIYADDCILFAAIYLDFDPNEFENAKDRINEIISKINKWMISRRLKLNISKTKLILFCPPVVKEKVLSEFNSLQVSIADSNINLQPVNELKLLGFTLDEDLTFESQISNVVKSCNYSLYNLKQVRRFIPRDLLIAVVQSEVISKIDYCNQLYIKITKKQLGRLQLIMNKAVRLIFRLQWRESITPFLRDQLHWLPVGARVDFSVILTAKKAILTGKSEYLNEYMISTRSRKGLFQRPRIEGRHAYAWRAFKYNAPALLNKVPKAIREIENIDSFKGQLKTFLFRECYDFKLDSILDYDPSITMYTYNV